MKTLSPNYLRECFDYDAATGALTWRIRPREHFKGGAGWHNFNNQFANRPAGLADKSGHIEVKLNGKGYQIARVIWAMQTGQMDFGLIDHIDGGPKNNRMSNLRLATHAQNARNRSHSSRNSSGVTGVTYHSQSGKWWARVTVGGKTHSFGLHKTVEGAAQVTYEAKQRLFGEYARVKTA